MISRSRHFAATSAAQPLPSLNRPLEHRERHCRLCGATWYGVAGDCACTAINPPLPEMEGDDDIPF